jgi:Flp pilus assembly secretin CpaC/tetratricopeptide (TPR) repeat protein
MSLGTSRAVRRSIRSLLASAGLAAVFAGAAPFAMAQTVLPAGLSPAKSTSAAETIQIASDLLAEGKAVRARNLLVELTMKGGGATLSDNERTRANTLLTNANRRVRALSPIDSSLQNADDCFFRGDYLAMEHHAQAVITNPKATNAQTAAARNLTVQAAGIRAELLPQVPSVIESINADVDAGRFDAARANLLTIVRSGVELTPDQEDLVTRLQNSLVDLDQGRRIAAAPGMMQPGVIRPREPEPEPATQPATQPTETWESVAGAAPAQPPADPIELARGWEAQSILAEADVAYEAARYNEAVAKYERVLRAFGDQLNAEQRTRAENRMAESKSRMGANVGPEGQALDRFIQTNTLKRSQALAEFNNNTEQAQRALTQGDTLRARELAAAARVNVASVRELFGAAEFEGYTKQVDDLMTQIDRRQGEIEAATIVDRDRARAEDARRQSEEAMRNKDRRIGEAIDRVRALQAELKYEEALQVIDQILFLDPINPTGLLMKDVISDILVYRGAVTQIGRNQRTYAQQSLQNLEALSAPPDIVTYPNDWPGISFRRGEPTSFTESEENRAVYAVLESRRIPVDFQDTPLANVINFLAVVTQLNFDVDWEKLQEASIDRESSVSLRLTNVPVKTVLERVLEKVSPDASLGAAYAVNDGVVLISTRDAINRNKRLEIYDIRDLLIEVPDYLNVPEFDLQAVLQGGGQGGGGGGQSPFREAQDDQVQRRTLEDRTNDLLNIITTNIDPLGWQENGGDVGFIQQFQGNLIITNTPANHRAINGLLAKLREARAMQINVECRFLLVSTDFFEQVGFDLDVYFNGNNNQVRAARAALPGGAVQPSDFFDFTRGGLQRRVFGSTDPDVQGGANIATPLPSPMSVVGAGQNSLGLAESLVSGNFAQGILSQAPALGVAGQFLDDIQVDFLVKATQADRRTVQLTAPRLTFTNGQTSNIIVATQVAFVSDLTPVVGESSVGFDPTTNTVPEGVTLLIDGTISADRRYVTMNVRASVSKIDSIVNVPVSALAAGQVVGSASAQSFIQVPTTTLTQVSTTVTVPDQGTILLGGQRLISEQQVESGVPVLSKIPLLSRFFSNRVELKEEQTLLILIKPTILIQNEEEERWFPGLSESIRFGG